MDLAASLQALEDKRKQLWAQLEALGDFRPRRHFGQLPQVRQGQLPLRSPRSSRARASVSVECHHRRSESGPQLTARSGAAEGGARGGSLSRFRPAVPRTGGSDREDLRPSPGRGAGGGGAGSAEKKITQEVLGEAEAEIERLAGRVLQEWQRRGEPDLEAGELAVSRGRCSIWEGACWRSSWGPTGVATRGSGSTVGVGTRRSLRVIGTSSS